MTKLASIETITCILESSIAVFDIWSSVLFFCMYKRYGIRLSLVTQITSLLSLSLSLSPRLVVMNENSLFVK